MDLNGFDFSKFTPRINTSFVDDMNRRNQEIIDSIIPLNEVIAGELKPLLEGNQKVVDGLADNYEKLTALYELKEKELAESKDEANKAKKYNTTMLIVAVASAGIALASLVASVLIAVL